MTTKSLRELFPPSGAGRAGGKYGADIDAGGDPAEWLDPVVLSKVAKGKHDAKSLWYGFSPYFARLDPYARIDRSKITNPLASGIAKFKNFLAAMRRFLDVALKFGTAVLSLPLIKQAQNAMAAVDNLAKATWAAYHLTNDVFGFWLPNQPGGDATGNRNMPFVGGFIDEFKSGAAARVGNLASSTQATIVSDSEPGSGDTKGWSLTAGTTYRMTIAWDGGSKTDAVVVAATAAPASLSITAPALSNQPETKTLAIRVGAWPIRTVSLNPTNTAADAAFASALGAVFTNHEGSAAVGSGGRVVVTGAPLVSVGVATAAATATLALPASAASIAVRVNGEAITLSPQAADIADLAAFETFASAALTGKATVAISGGALLITPDEPAVKLVDQNDTRALLGRMSATASAFTSSANTLTLAPPRLSPTGEQQELALTIDGTTLRVQLHGGTNLYTALNAIPQASLLATIAGTGNAVTVTSKVNGLASTVSASVVSDTGWSFTPTSKEAHGIDGAGPKLTLDELIALIPSLDGASASKAVDTLVLTANTEGNGSHVSVSGNLADLVFGSKSKSETISGDASTSASPPTTFEDDYKKLISWNHELQKLPEDTRNLTRPVTNAISDAVAALSAVEAAVESTVSIVGEGVLKGLPQPPESIGLVARDGISLGTTDRIVGAGGKGVVFIADGGSGTENHTKFIPRMEPLIAGLMAWDPIDKAWDKAIRDPVDPAKDKPPSLGFRVYSDSAADLYGTYSAQLLAVGRGKLTGKTADGKQVVGVGIARVAGSHAVEIAGYRRVVIDARNLGTKDDDGGRVDVLGQTIFVGGFNLDGKMKDFESTAGKGAGLEPLALDFLAGAEHLEDATKANLAKTVKNLGWTKTLRDKHANTNFIRFHAAKEATTVVGGFMLHVTEKDGFSLGTRKDAPDPSKNAIDDTKSYWTVKADEIVLRQKKDAPGLELTAKKTLLTFGKDQPYVMLDGKQATMQTGDGKASLSLSGSKALLKYSSTKVHLHQSGLNVKAQQIALGGSKVTIG